MRQQFCGSACINLAPVPVFVYLYSRMYLYLYLCTCTIGCTCTCTVGCTYICNKNKHHCNLSDGACCVTFSEEFAVVIEYSIITRSRSISTRLTQLLDAGGQCDAACDTDGELHCWGAGPDMCQTRKTLFSLALCYSAIKII